MALIVQKYGGTSVGNTDRIKAVAERIFRTQKEGNKVVVVVSAMGDTTDELIELAHQITKKPSEREMDMLISTGEQVSIALLTMALHALGAKAICFTGPQVGIITDSSHTKARIITVNTKRIEEHLDRGEIVVVAGFQGQDENGEITTLGRGGSDTTALALAAALKADMCEIYTDVEGVFSADPRIVPNARKIERLSYDEMLELASLGAQVLQHRAVEFAKKYRVPIHVRSSFTDKEGTIVTEETRGMEEVLVRGVTLNKDEAKLTIVGVPDRPGIAARIFQEIADAGINVDMIIQNVGEGGVSDISFTVSKGDLDKAMRIVEQVASELGAKRVDADQNIAKVSVVGVGMRSHPGVAATMFGALAKAGINIEMISTSEIKISCVIDEARGEEAVRILHDAFELALDKDKLEEAREG